MADQSKQDVSVGKTDFSAKAEFSVKAEIKADIPPDVTRDVTNRLLDALSPFTEVFGYVGDLIRLKRQETLLKIVQRSREIAEEKNAALNKVQPKFLAPFLEKASLEDEKSPLIEMWAHLLVSASESPERNLNWCLRILDELDSAEAMILSDLAERLDYRAASHSDSYTQALANEDFQRTMELAQSRTKEYFLKQIRTAAVMHILFEEENVPNWNELILIGFDEGERGLHLESLGLVWVFASKIRTHDDKGLYVIRIQLTPLGNYFVKTVQSEH